jgi:hypothetical protein
VKRIIFLVLLLSSYASLPVSAFAAEAEGTGWGWIETIGRWANLFILIGAIYYFTRAALKKFFVDRRRGIVDEIEAAQSARSDAESQLEEMESRVGALDEELAELSRQAEQEAQDERNRRRSSKPQGGRLVDWRRLHGRTSRPMQVSWQSKWLAAKSKLSWIITRRSTL